MEVPEDLSIYARQNTRGMMSHLNSSADPSIELFRNSQLNAVVLHI